MVHIRQSRPDYGLGYQAKALKVFEVSPLRSEADQEKARERALLEGEREREDRLQLLPPLDHLVWSRGFKVYGIL